MVSVNKFYSHNSLLLDGQVSKIRNKLQRITYSPSLQESWGFPQGLAKMEENRKDEQVIMITQNTPHRRLDLRPDSPSGISLVIHQGT